MRVYSGKKGSLHETPTIMTTNDDADEVIYSLCLSVEPETPDYIVSLYLFLAPDEDKMLKLEFCYSWFFLFCWLDATWKLGNPTPFPNTQVVSLSLSVFGIFADKPS